MRRELTADSAQARELEERPQRDQVVLDFFADENAQVEPESPEKLEAANAARRARIKRAMEQIEMILGYRK